MRAATTTRQPDPGVALHDMARHGNPHACSRRATMASMAVLILGSGAFWMLLYPYWGINHDAILYTLGALAHLQPELLGPDLFLRYGSQDQFTLFSPLYAGLIRLFDLDAAAALLTFVSQAALFGGAWLLARRFMPATLATFATGLFIVMPSGYGAYLIFNYVEGFLTPRLLAEALVLGGIAAACARRPAWACLGVLAGAAIHPIMAAAGVIMLGFLWLVVPRPKPMLITGAVVLGALTLLAALFPYGPFAQIDPEWLKLLMDRSGFIFLSPWSFQDWVRACIPLGLLIAAALVCAQQGVRNLCIAALLTASLGLLVTAIACDGLRLITVARIQPWRWLWLAQAIGVLIIPLLVRDAWRLGTAGRISLILLATTWIFRGQSFNELALVILVFALLAIVAATRGWRPRQSRALWLCALGALTISIAFCMADKIPLLLPEGASQSIPFAHRIRFIANDGLLPATILALLLWSMRQTARAWPRWTSFGLAAAGCISLGPYAWHSWSLTNYSAKFADFTSWRSLIPAGSEVLWPDQPVNAWYWLQRPSYLSIYQTAGIIFSRDTAIEAHRRAAIAGPLLPPHEMGDWIPPAVKDVPDSLKLPLVCASREVDFVVTEKDLGVKPVTMLALYPEHPRVRLRLYRCADVAD